MEHLKNVIFILGYNGPIILVVLSTWLFRHTPTTLLFYYAGNVANIFINLILKNLIKEPRPDEDSSKLEWLSSQNKSRFEWDKYGMPSGHAQLMFYSVVYVYNSLHNMYWTAIYLIISCNTIVQRLAYKNHTTQQLLVGSIIGSLAGYELYNILHQFRVIS